MPDAYKKTCLDNGIRVVTDTEPSVRSMSIACLVGAGPQDESNEQNGLAHFVEHLMFQGTTSRDASQIADFMDRAGGNIGAFTARDYTCYFANVLDEYQTFGIELLSDILLNSIYPPERLESERDAILNEINTGYDIPGKLANSLLKSTAWAGHPIGRPVAGKAESVGKLTREDAIYFVHENYWPDRMIVAAAGNVIHEDFCAIVRDGFWRLLGKSWREPPPPPVHHGGIVFRQAPLKQAYFCIGVPAYSYDHKNRYALHVLNTLFGGGMSSRLFRHVRKERGLVYHITSDYEAYRDAGMLVIDGCTVPEYLSEVLDVVLAELSGLATGKPIDDEELLRSKMQIRSQHLLSGENMNTRMSRLATQEFYFNRVVTADEILDDIESIEKSSLVEVANDLMHNAIKNVTIAVVGPDAPEHYSQEKISKVVEKYR
ncbi:MAG: pitrilysin family protein [Myxococcota bacterium]